MANYRVEKDRTHKPKRWIVRDLARGQEPIEINGLVWWKTFKAANAALTSMVRDQITDRFLAYYKEKPDSEWAALWGVLQLSIIAGDTDYQASMRLYSLIDTVTVASRLDELRVLMCSSLGIEKKPKISGFKPSSCEVTYKCSECHTEQTIRESTFEGCRYTALKAGWRIEDVFDRGDELNATCPYCGGLDE